MFRGRWSLILALLFMAILAWYLVYTERVIRAFRSDLATMTRMYSEVQAGLADPEEHAADGALVRIQDLILESGLPLVLTGPGDTILSAVNLPFAADLSSSDGQARVREYARRLEARNPPVGDPDFMVVHYGDPPELQRLRWIPWFQVGGLLVIFLTGVLVIRAQRRAATDRAWMSMARELAHQLGTPISSLQGWLAVLETPRDRRPGDVGEEEVARQIGTDVERLERISRRFELLGREPSMTRLDLEAVIRATETYLQPRIPRLGPGIALEVSVAPDLPALQGNEVLLTWALENIVKNALDALAGRGGTITLRAFHQEPGWVTLQVEDTGPGVDPEVRDRLFDAGVTTKAAGWGVGLSLARRIVERVHEGRIELLRSGASGSVFQLRLPAAGAQDGSPGTGGKER